MISFASNQGSKNPPLIVVSLYVAELCIDNREQGNGYGTSLLTYLEKKLTSIGIESLYLITANDGKAKSFYQKNDYFIHDNRLVMKKLLT
ncbi:GNAT family N-acetyltransferase [Gracilibacillus salinarum]|uniref:GNAT family N-acetyltransferase n=1 Tax=Gracilibacillus salinarum TaxID=2932255 RepID=UPI0034E2D4B3